MLVLTRKVDEALNIGDDVKVIILGKSGDRVKVGIEAPKHVRVVRSELLEGKDECSENS